MRHDPVFKLGWHSVYGQVGRRRFGYDPYSHGRFTTIVDRKENGLHKAEHEGTLYVAYPNISHSVPDTMISITVGSVS